MAQAIASRSAGRSTTQGIQSRLYFGTRALVRELTREMRKRVFGGDGHRHGGFSRPFEQESLFHALLPDLTLLGLRRALALNPDGSARWQASAP